MLLASTLHTEAIIIDSFITFLFYYKKKPGKSSPGTKITPQSAITHLGVTWVVLTTLPVHTSITGASVNEGHSYTGIVMCAAGYL